MIIRVDALTVRCGVGTVVAGGILPVPGVVAVLKKGEKLMLIRRNLELK